MGRLRDFIKRITHPFLKRGLQYYYQKPRPYTYKGITTMVHPDVFPPHLTFSTKILLDFISDVNFAQKTFLELGCGSGIISLFASKKGAVVTASDINKIALEQLEIAASKNKLLVNCVYSNLFNEINSNHFDYILINPPYYPKSPETIKQQAWYCGTSFEYFEQLFEQIPSYLSKENATYMILSEDCKIEIIKGIASKNAVQLLLVFETVKAAEKNYIFQLIKK